MLVQGCLVPKLPASRCIDLCASGPGHAVRARPRRPPREWSSWTPPQASRGKRSGLRRWASLAAVRQAAVSG